MPPSATPCHRALAAPVGRAANDRNCDGSTPSTAVEVPLIRILTASMRSACDHAGQPAHRGEQPAGQRERRDDEQVRLDRAAQRRHRGPPVRRRRRPPAPASRTAAGRRPRPSAAPRR